MDMRRNSKLVIAAQPAGNPVSGRAVTEFYLKECLKDSSLRDFDIHSILLDKTLHSV